MNKKECDLFRRSEDEDGDICARFEGKPTDKEGGKCKDGRDEGPYCKKKLPTAQTKPKVVSQHKPIAVQGQDLVSNESL